MGAGCGAFWDWLHNWLGNGGLKMAEIFKFWKNWAPFTEALEPNNKKNQSNMAIMM